MVKSVGKAKVGDDDVSMLVEQEVFELEISMDNVLLVQVVNTGNELGKELGGVSLFQVFIGQNVVEKLST